VVLILAQNVQNLKMVANRFHRIKVRSNGYFKKNILPKTISTKVISWISCLEKYTVKLLYCVKQGCGSGYGKDPFSFELLNLDSNSEYVSRSGSRYCNYPLIMKKMLGCDLFHIFLLFFSGEEHTKVREDLNFVWKRGFVNPSIRIKKISKCLSGSGSVY
jgi:hypothetical protein